MRACAHLINKIEVLAKRTYLKECQRWNSVDRDMGNNIAEQIYVVEKLL